MAEYLWQSTYGRVLMVEYLWQSRCRYENAPRVWLSGCSTILDDIEGAAGGVPYVGRNA